MTGSELATYRATVALVTTAAQGIVSVYRQNRTISRGQIQLLRLEAEKAVALQRARALGDLTRTNLRELIDTSRIIESLDDYNPALPYCMNQLEHLSRALQRIIDDF